MLSSFYGGKQGRSYHIVAHYDSIYDMFTHFAKGPEYMDVAFDEYVIIDTILHNNNKQDIENGIIYRRGYNYNEPFSEQADTITYKLNRERFIEQTLTGNEIGVPYRYEQNNTNNYGTLYTATVSIPDFYNFTYTFINNTTAVIDENSLVLNLDKWNQAWNDYVLNPGGGAIYVGQIVGPEGSAAAASLVDWDTFEQAIEARPQETNKGKFFVTPYPGYDPSHAGEHATEDNLDEYGYDEQGFLDVQQYGYCTVRDAQGNITNTFLTFSFPYVIFNIEAHGISAYPNNNGIEDYIDPVTGVRYHFNSDTRLWEYDNLIKENDDSVNHKFYKHYDIQIPKGVHGQDINELVIKNKDITSSDITDVYDENGNYLSNVLVRNPDDSIKYDASGNPVLKIDFANQYLTYKTKNYDTSEGGEVSQSQLISPFRIITDVENTTKIIAPEVSEGSTNKYVHNYPKEIVWHYTHGAETKVDYSIIERIWVQVGDTEDPAYNEDGNIGHLTDSHLYVLYSVESLPRDLGLIKFVTNIWTQENTDSTQQDQDGNILTENCVYVQLTGEEAPRYLGLIKRVDDIWVQEDNDPNHPGTKEIDNLGNTVKKDYIYTQLTNEPYPHELGFIRKITSITKPEGSKDLYVNYNYNTTGGENVPEKIPVVEINKVAFNGDLFLMQYKDIEGHEDDYQQTYNYNGEKWVNLGTVIKGNHVWTNFYTYNDLVADYPDGLGQDLTTSERAGWLVTVGHDNKIVIDTTTHRSVSEDNAIIVHDEQSDTYTIELPVGSIYGDTTNLEIEDAVGYKLYGFDYRENRWYNVQDMTAGAVKAEYTVLVAFPDQSGNQPDDINKNQLNVNGLWFVEFDN